MAKKDTKGAAKTGTDNEDQDTMPQAGANAPEVAPEAPEAADNADGDAVIAELKQIIAEQAEQLAAHEKITSETVIHVRSRAARVMGGCIHKGKRYTKQEVAADADLCAELADMGSDLIQFVN